MTFTPGISKVPNSGRKPGTPNRETTLVQELVDELGCNPLEILARVAMGDALGLGLVTENDHPSAAREALPIALRVKAASEIAGYLVPKRKAIEHSGHIEERQGGVLLVPAPMSMDEWTAMVESQHRGPK
jgi:hypothetical protein